MARSYRIKSDQLEEVHIFVDTRRGFNVLHDFDLYRSGAGISLEEVPSFCFDASKFPDGLPEGVYKETASFAPTSFAVSEEIDAESLKYDSDNTANIRIDLSKRTNLRIKYLLRHWTLSDEDQSLTLTTYQRPADGRIHLTKESIALINNEVNPRLVKAFMEAYELKQRSAFQQIEDDAINAVKEGSGGRIAVKN
jgi:hypothetical protein